MDLAAGPDRHWHEHRYNRNADRTSTGSTPGTSHRRPGASDRILCGAAAVATGAGPRRLWLLVGSGPGCGPGRRDHRGPDAASAVAAVRRGRADRRCDPVRRLGAAVLLEPREGPSGWRSVVSSPVAGEVALWQAK